MRLEAQNLICCIQEILLHKLGAKKFYVEHKSLRNETYHAGME